MAMSTTAAPPIAIPAMSPPVSTVPPLESEFVDAVGLAVADEVVPEVLDARGWMLSYASQSGLGSARGHSSFKQMESSLPLTAGAHLLLYMVFMSVSFSNASSEEKP